MAASSPFILLGSLDAMLEGDDIAVYGDRIEVLVAQGEEGIFHFDIADAETVESQISDD